MASEITLAALGRPFTLGMLYDAREDKLITGVSLWDDKIVNDNTVITPQKTSTFVISTSDSLKEKSNMLEVEASLKASFLSGLISLDGSAKYLDDNKEFKNQSRVTLQYKSTTKFSRLSLTPDEAKTMGNVDNVIGLATHVVTGIKYGANAFFVFDSERLDSNQVQTIEGTMKAVINKIPKLNVEGNVSVSLSDKEKALAQSFSCKFFGDFLLPINPTTFDEAVKVYQQLSQQLGKDGENSVPIQVCLTPLKSYDPKAAKLVHEICPGLVKKIEETLEHIKEIEMRCRDCLAETVVKKFHHIENKLKCFEKLCRDYTNALKDTMMEEFPLIRAGEKDARLVEKQIDDSEKSLFSYAKLSSWMGDREREISAIKACVDIMEGGKFISNLSDLDSEILAPGVEHTLCFAFTSLESADPYLDVLANSIHKHELNNTSDVSASKKNQWYLSNEVMYKMRQKAKTFQEMAKALKKNSKFHFLVVAKENPNYQGATIYHYKGIDVATEDFSKPDIPPVETVKDKGTLIWYARDLTLNPDTAYNYLILSEDNKKATYGAWQTYPDHPDRFDTSPQVLCKEELNDRCYWEVEWNECYYYNNVGVGVTYKGIGRKGSSNETAIGSNTTSWYLGQYGTLCAYHNGQVWTSSFPPSCRRVGVFLDYTGGTLTFYNVVCDTLEHLYTFKAKFTQPVYPGFYINKASNFVYLCPVV